MVNGNFRAGYGFDLEAFLERFRSLLDSRGMRMTDLAKATDLSLATMSKWNRMERAPSLIALREIADFFGVSIDWLIGRTTDKFSAYTPEQVAIMEAYTTLSDKDRFVVDALLFNRHE